MKLLFASFVFTAISTASLAADIRSGIDGIDLGQSEQEFMQNSRHLKEFRQDTRISNDLIVSNYHRFQLIQENNYYISSLNRQTYTVVEVYEGKVVSIAKSIKCENQTAYISNTITSIGSPTKIVLLTYFWESAQSRLKISLGNISPGNYKIRSCPDRLDILIEDLKAKSRIQAALDRAFEKAHREQEQKYREKLD